MGQGQAVRWWMVIVGVLMAGAIATAATPTPAQSCRLGDRAAPSPDQRTFENSALGIAFQIPANYRAMLRNTGHVTFHDPTTFEFIQCLSRTGRYGTLPPHTTLEVSPGVSGQDLTQIVRRKRPWLDFYNPVFAAVDLNGRPALRYAYSHAIDRTEILSYSFLAKDGQTLLTLSGPAQDPVLTQAIATLTFLDGAIAPLQP